MQPATVPPAEAPPPEPPCPPDLTLSQITQLVDHLLPAIHTITSFTSRWLILRSKLTSLKPLLTGISSSSSSSPPDPHWSHNPLLPALLHNLLQTLTRIQTLQHHCSSSTTPAPGKLLMQSDLDIAANWLDKQTNDLNLLLSSGVLHHHHHSTAIVLSHPDRTSSDKHLSFFVRDLFTRLQIGGIDFKLQALQTLVQLLGDGDGRRCAAIIAKEVKLGCLISLLDVHSDDSVRELAVHAVALLVSGGDDSPRKCVFEEGGLGPLLRMMAETTCLVPMRDRAAMAVEFITSDVDNAWAVSAYGGVPVLIEVCRSGSVAAQSHAVGAIRNMCAFEDIRVSLVEEGVVPVLMNLIDGGSASAQGKAANCLSILASGECFRSLLLRDGVLQGLLRLFHDECPVGGTVEHVLRTVYSLSASDAGCRILSGSSVFLVQLSEIVKHGNVRLQHVAASLLARLLISDGNKVTIGRCMSSLVKLIESVKPDGMQEVGARLLVSLLSVKSNRKDFVRDEKSVMRLVKMLDPRNDYVFKKFPVAVVSALVAGGSQSCRKRLVEGGALGHLQRLAEADVMGAKKALQRLSGNNRLTSIFTWTWRE